MDMRNLRSGSRGASLGVLLAAVVLIPRITSATVVEFQTVMGNIEINLFDNSTPQTVANFLSYVNNGAYTGSVMHRSVAGFVVQGGGFAFDMAVPLQAIPTNPPVTNEPEWSNVRGTIAMAKLGGDPNSATNQWFFNLADNSANLNAQNGGFTVFGQVVGNGMDVVDAIAALPTFGFAQPLTDLPLQNYSAADFNAGVAVTANNLMIINSVIVSDSTVDSAAGLSPVPNTSNSGGNAVPTPAPAASTGGGGGSLGLLSLFALLQVFRRRNA